MPKLKRSYLNDSEENLFMVMRCLTQMMEGVRSKSDTVTEEVWREWTQRGMMTPNMKKNIKMAYTYLNKFADELYESLDSKQQSKLDRRLEKCNLNIVDEYKQKMIFREIKDKLKYVALNRDTFENILVDMAQVRCVGCNEDYKKCELCKAIEESMLPYLGEKSNCPYAVDLSQYTPEEKEDYEEILKRVRNNNKFFKG